MLAGVAGRGVVWCGGAERSRAGRGVGGGGVIGRRGIVGGGGGVALRWWALQGVDVGGQA